MNLYSPTAAETSSFQTMMESLLGVSLIGSAVVILALVIHRAVGRWLSPMVLYVFWLLVIVRFVLFAVPASPVSFLNLLPQTELNDVQPALVVSEVTYGIFDSPGNSLTALNQAAFEAPLDGDTSSTVTLWTIVKLVWLAGMAWLSWRLLTSYLRVRGVVVQSRPAPAELTSMFDRLKQQLGLSPTVRLRITEQLDVPAVAGIVRPTVLMPTWCRQELTERQIEMIFAHELIHIRRHDGLIQLVTHLIAMLHWFNPLVRVAGRCIEASRELSCDDRVIKLLSREHESTANMYGQTILRVAERGIGCMSSDCVFVGGFTGNEDHLIKQRIAMLVRPNSKWKVSVALVAGIFGIVLMLAVGFTSAQSTDKPVQGQAKAVVQDSPQTFAPPRAVKVDPNAIIADEIPAPNQTIKMVAGTKQTLKFEYRIPEISIDSPKIADVSPISPTEFVVSAKKIGSTSIMVMNEQKEFEHVKIRVVKPQQEQKKQNTNGKLVKVETEIIEVSKARLLALGIDYARAGEVKRRVKSMIFVMPKSSLVDQSFKSFLSGLQKNNVAETISQPNIITLDGLTAEVFLGECVPRKIEDPTGKTPTITENVEVGYRLRVTPKINEDLSLNLDITTVHTELAVDSHGQSCIYGNESNSSPKLTSGQTYALLVGGDWRDTDTIFLITPSLVERQAEKQVDGQPKYKLRR